MMEAMMPGVNTFSCLAGHCTRQILIGLFCAEHAYLADRPQGLWVVRSLDERTRELRGVWWNGVRWGIRR